jgi:hypothetical protein
VTTGWCSSDGQRPRHPAIPGAARGGGSASPSQAAAGNQPHQGEVVQGRRRMLAELLAADLTRAYGRATRAPGCCGGGFRAGSSSSSSPPRLRTRLGCAGAKPKAPPRAVRPVRQGGPRHVRRQLVRAHASRAARTVGRASSRLYGVRPRAVRSHETCSIRHHLASSGSAAEAFRAVPAPSTGSISARSISSAGGPEQHSPTAALHGRLAPCRPRGHTQSGQWSVPDPPDG